MNKAVKFLIIFFLIFANSYCFAGGMSSVIYSIGDLSLGMTKSEIINILGQPSSPLKHDFTYETDKNIFMIAFDDKGKTESIIIKKGNGKYSLLGIKIGSSKNQVMNAFSKPEYIKKYKLFKREIWSYPSSNVYFTFKKDKVATFAVCGFNCDSIK